MDLGLKNKTALVLGAGGGLGSAIAQSLAREGVNLALADIDIEAARRTAALAELSGVAALPIRWDLAQLDQVDAHVSQIEQAMGSIGILVNNTGGPPPSQITGQSPEIWQTWFRAMVQSIISTTDRVLPAMREAKWGRIITSASSGVVSPIPNLGLSNALRSTLVGWSKTLAGEVARDGVTANIVLPGRISTQRILFLDDQKAKREGRDIGDVQAQSLSSIPAGRYGEPGEYGDVVAFIASERSSYINGSIIRVDGSYISGI